MCSDMYEGRIVIDPEVRHGKPVIRNTRVPVDIILGSLAGGMNCLLYTSDAADE